MPPEETEEQRSAKAWADVQARAALRRVKECNRSLDGMREFDDPRHGKIFVTKHVYALIEKNRQESCPQKSPAWYKRRTCFITGSMFATVCNANPYEKRSVALRKKTGQEKPFQGNKATEHGNKYEHEALLRYEKLTGAKVLEFGLMESLNEGEHFLAASPDGITSSGRLIEIKCPYRRIPKKEIPKHYKYQIQFMMHIFRLAKCDFIQYVPETELMAEVFIVTTEDYDPWFFYSRFAIAKSFWEEVLLIREQRAQMDEAELEAEREAQREAERKKEEMLRKREENYGDKSDLALRWCDAEPLYNTKDGCAPEFVPKLRAQPLNLDIARNRIEERKQQQQEEEEEQVQECLL